MKKVKINTVYSTMAPLLLALAVGILAGLGALFFRWLIEFMSGILWQGGEKDFLLAFNAAPWQLKLTVPVMVGLALGPLLTKFAYETRGPGVPEVIEALNMRDGLIRHRITMAKSLATATFIAAGASVGREGPIVQIGASIGSSITQIFRMSHDNRRLAVACGAAAGIAATFHAPMAGTMFVVEILLYDLDVESLSSIVIAAVTGTVISKLFLADEVLFDIPFFSLSHPAELYLYLIMGIAAGVFSLLFMAIVFGTNRMFEKFNIPDWLTPAIGGSVLGGIGLFFPEVLGIGYDTVNGALHENMLSSSAAILLFAKLFATGICTGSGMSGGIFAPSLFLGAMLGTLFGAMAHLFWPDAMLSPSHFALVGMGAVVAGTTLAPVTAVLTIFELTYNYEVVLPLMTACIPSIVVVRLIHSYSIYETKLLTKGVHITKGHDVNRLRAMKVRDYICRDMETVRKYTPFEDFMPQVLTSTFPHFIVLDEKDRLAGVITLRDTRAIIADSATDKSDMTVGDIMQRDVVTVRENQNLEEAFNLFARRNFSFLPVVSESDPYHVLGCLKKDDLLTAYNQHVLHEQFKPSSRWICHLQE